MPDKSEDAASRKMIEKARGDGVRLAWGRLESQEPQCGFGLLGLCCRNCNMGPCRIDPFGEGPGTGVCGAQADTIVARNLLRMIAAGASAHSDHGRDVVSTLLAHARGAAPDYAITDTGKLGRLAGEFGIPVEGREPREVAADLASAALEEFGTTKGHLQFVARAPRRRRELWEKLGLSPRGIDREVVEAMHRTNMGVDTDHSSLILHGVRCALADGWGGSMLATEFSDVLFGTPQPVKGWSNLGVLREDMVNVVVHGHEPLLSEMIVRAAREPELVSLAEANGATGINVAGMCCTGNEILARHGVPVAGNFLQQELAIATGAIEAMVVDVQCVMPSLTQVARCYHTLMLSTSPKARFPGAEHVEFSEHNALEAARTILRRAVENFRRRQKEGVEIPRERAEYMAGFSVEAILAALGGSPAPLLEALKRGQVRGITAVVGCNNPKTVQDRGHITLTTQLIKNDVLVLQTGCAAIATAKAGLLLPEAAEHAGTGLAAVCAGLGVPPVLHMGSCVDISRILVLAAAAATALDVDIADLPVAAAAPEWMSEKAVSIGAYAVGSGVFTVLGTVPPVLGAQGVSSLLTRDAARVVGATFAVEADPVNAAQLILAHIDAKRKALGI